MDECIPGSEIACLRNAMQSFEAYSDNALHSLFGIKWFRAFLICTVYQCAGLSKHRNLVDIDGLRYLAVHIFYHRIKSKYGSLLSDASIQATKVVVSESVRLALSIVVADSSVTVSEGALTEPKGGGYLGINVPEPHSHAYWVTRCDDDHEESLCQLTHRERHVLYLLWSAKGKYVRADVLCDKVYSGSDDDDFRQHRNRLNVTMHKLRKKLAELGMAVFYSVDSDGYALLLASEGAC